MRRDRASHGAVTALQLLQVSVFGIEMCIVDENNKELPDGVASGALKVEDRG